LGVRQGSLLFPCLRTGALCCGGSNCHIIGSCLSSLAAVSAPRPVPGQVASPASGSPCGAQELFSAHPLLSLVPLSLSSPGPALSARCALGFPAPATLIPPASLRRPKKNKRARPVHVSILTRPRGRVLPFFHNGPERRLRVSILTRPRGRVLPIPLASNHQ